MAGKPVIRRVGGSLERAQMGTQESWVLVQALPRPAALFLSPNALTCQMVHSSCPSSPQQDWIMRSKQENTHGSTSVRKAVALNIFLLRSCLQSDPGGLSLKSSNKVGKKGHPCQFCPEDDRWTTARIFKHFWGYRPQTQLQALSPEKSRHTSRPLEKYCGCRDDDSCKRQRN